jgi:ABC-type antimicrobial peptide transport system permease subunit
MLRGRGFTEADNDTAPLVAVVNETFVRRFFPQEDPIDKHFGIDLPENAGKYRIVGVVHDAKYADPERPVGPMFFVPLAQYTPYSNELIQKLDERSHLISGIVLHTHGRTGALEPVLQKTLADVDPNLAVNSLRAMQQQVELVFDQQRAVASLAGLFGIVALALAAVGLYGVTAYSVAQRTNEMGIRMALGASRTRVIQMVLGGAFQHVALGLFLGIPLAIGAGRLISAQLYGVASWDPMALSVATVSLGVCAFLATIVPALRAASIAPMDALRAE